LRAFLKYLFFASLIALGVGFYAGDALPPPERILPELAREPLQEAVTTPPFETTVNHVAYHISPRYRYELYGLVVSKHEADGFWDYVHQQWGDHLNAADLCVVWGQNAFSGVYRDIRFDSGQWTCYWYAPTQEIWHKFVETQASNNHMLADQRGVLRNLKEVRVGDQIYFRGYLAEYSHAGGFHRGTSTTRTDTGNGACETVYTEDFRILQRGPRHWLWLRWGATLALLTCVVAWFALPHDYHVKG
jgi:hypothetical protein